MANDRLYGVIACAVTTVIVLVIFLLTLAVNKLDTTEVGLDYNGISKRVDETRLYEAGRYFLGVRHSFIRFPKLMQTIHFDEEIADTLTTKTIRGRTGDGLAVKVSASFQYRLIPTVESIVMLYKDFGLEWEDFLVVLARDVIRDVFSEFTAFDVFQRRREMNDLTFVYLERAFEEYGHVRLESVQILGIILPDDYNAALRDTQIKKQEIVEAEFDRQTALINRDTAILAATTQAQVIALAANATATSTLLQASAEAAAVQLNIRAEQNAFLQLSDNLNITDPETLNAFIFVQALRQTQSEVLLGVELPDQLGF